MDEVVFIDGGKIIISGNKDEILEKHAIVKCKKDDLCKISESLMECFFSFSLALDYLEI